LNIGTKTKLALAIGNQVTRNIIYKINRSNCSAKLTTETLVSTTLSFKHNFK